MADDSMADESMAHGAPCMHGIAGIQVRKY